MLTPRELLIVVKAHCILNYEAGFHWYVECYTDDEMTEYLEENECKTLKQFIESTVAFRDHAEEIQNTAF